MKKLVSIGAVMIVATAVAGFALAGTFEKSGSLKNGTASYTMKVSHPKKIILYPESSQVKTSYSIVCLKGTKVSQLSRTFTTPFTRNLLWHIPPRQDVCYLAVAAATAKDVGQVVVQVTN
ncbi:MAG TPA: hypothetical protein VJ716_02245 [Gaiellaceae bacterium]|nr:hypothetical protein [Gaiellaceae bacterium]